MVMFNTAFSIPSLVVVLIPETDLISQYQQAFFLGGEQALLPMV
jgi:hypothetical protein